MFAAVAVMERRGGNGAKIMSDRKKKNNNNPLEAVGLTGARTISPA